MEYPASTTHTHTHKYHTPCPLLEWSVSRFISGEKKLKAKSEREGTGEIEKEGEWAGDKEREFPWSYYISSFTLYDDHHTTESPPHVRC